jgi:hypothetical protein
VLRDPLLPSRRDHTADVAGRPRSAAGLPPTARPPLCRRTRAQAVAARTAAALAAGHDLLLLGGDCTVELGAVAGAIGRFASVGLVYVDGDTDLNPPEASDGALDWTGVAHLLDLPGTTEELAGLGGTRPMLGSEDVLNFAAFPIAENTRRDRGLTLEELDAVLVELRAMPAWRVLGEHDVSVCSPVRRQPSLSRAGRGVRSGGLSQARRAGGFKNSPIASSGGASPIGIVSATSDARRSARARLLVTSECRARRAVSPVAPECAGSFPAGGPSPAARPA